VSSSIDRLKVCLFAAVMCLVTGISTGLAQDPYKAPPMPSMELGGLPGLEENLGDITQEESAEELQELLDPGTKKRKEMREYRRNLAIYMFTNLSYDKKKQYDPRAEAARNMSEFVDEEEIRNLLFERGVKVYFDESPGYIPACISSYMKAGTNNWPQLRENLRRGPDWTIRGRMASVMKQYQKVLDPEAVREELVFSMLHDPSEDVRGPVAKTFLGTWGKDKVPEELEPTIKKMLYEEDNTLIKYILFWHRYGWEKDLPLMREVLQSAEQWESRWFAMRRIWSARYRGGQKLVETKPEIEDEVVEELVRVTREDPDSRLRFLGVETLFYFDNPAALKAVLEVMQQDADPEVRGYCARLISYRKPEGCVGALMKVLNDEDPFVRFYAARALGALEADKAVGALKGLYDDPETWVADEARKAVAQLASR
jgi:hypothetical protein